MDYGHLERHNLHHDRIMVALEIATKKSDDGWPYASDVYRIYTSLQLPHPYKHLSYRQFNKRLQSLAQKDVIDRYITPLGGHGVRSVIRLKEK